MSAISFCIARAEGAPSEFVQADRLDQVLADRLVLGGEIRVAGERLLDLLRVTAAQRSGSMPRQEGFDLLALGQLCF